MGHIHADLMAQYAEDAKQYDKPWELWQHGDGETWVRCSTHPGWHTDHFYRRKPRTVQIGDIEVPEPCKVEPEDGQAAVPDNWRDQFSEAVYEDLSAADNQDVPLEEYPARILNVLDAIVGPRHPTVIKWRNDAIRSCIAIAYKYCSDPESYRYLKQDLEAMLAAPAHPAEGVPAQAADAQDAARWRETIKHVGDEDRFSAARYVIRGIEAPRNVMRGSVAEHFTKSIDAALAAQAKQGDIQP